MGGANSTERSLWNTFYFPLLRQSQDSITDPRPESFITPLILMGYMKHYGFEMIGMVSIVTMNIG
jgi:hypothetical protein